MSETTTPEAERRQHSHVRDIFVQACELLAPIIAGNAQIKTVSNFAMTHMLKDHFPELSSAEINIVIVTAEKIHLTQRINGVAPKKS